MIDLALLSEKKKKEGGETTPYLNEGVTPFHSSR